MSGFVALEGVSHAYGGGQAGRDAILAVEDLTISVNRGEFAAVVGPSGCGKSTLMKLATGLQFPFKGAIQVANTLVAERYWLAEDANRTINVLLNDMLETGLLPMKGRFLPGFAPKRQIADHAAPGDE